MKETNESVKHSASKKINNRNLNTYLNVKKINIWSNDKFFLFQSEK